MMTGIAHLTQQTSEVAANQYPHFSDEETESQDIQLRSHSWQAAMMSKLRPFQSKEDFKKKSTITVTTKCLKVT